MHAASTRYDPQLQMLIDPPREPDLARLRFLRWLAEHDRLEHSAVGAPVGLYGLLAMLERPAAA